MSEDMREIIITINGKKYRCINDDEPTSELEELRKRFIKKRNEWVGFDIEDEAEQLVAVKKNGYDIEHIQNPSEAVQLAAIKDRPDAIAYIHNPTEAVLRYAAEHGII